MSHRRHIRLLVLLISPALAGLTFTASGRPPAASAQPLARAFELVYATSDTRFAGRSNFRERDGAPEFTTEQ
ncbi:MAG: hypothetical protein ACRDJ9_34945, partial [Dehalococcoidia bacterium]